MSAYELVAHVLPAWAQGWGWRLIVAAIIWTLPWKAIALWRAARRGHTGWVLALVLVNTLGVLEILYIFVFSNRRASHTA